MIYDSSIVIHYHIQKSDNGGDNVTDSHKNFNSYVPSMEYVLQLNNNDVLCGRGSGPNDHIGNIRFRDEVSGHRIQYMKTNKRKDKDRIARDILNFVSKRAEPSGRFLKKLGGRVVKDVGFAKGVDVWMEVDEGTALEKVKQALRQNLTWIQGYNQERSKFPSHLS